MRSVVPLVLTALIIGCRSSAPVPAVHPEPARIQRRQPTEFLEYLKQSSVSCVWAEPEDTRNWVADSEMDALIGRLDSKAVCAGVVVPWSSRGTPWSTEGHEAAYIIEGFRLGRYPVFGRSDEFVAQPEELRAWYVVRKLRQEMLR